MGLLVKIDIQRVTGSPAVAGLRPAASETGGLAPFTAVSISGKIFGQK